ncbi:hypothetical protein ACFQJ7_07680 [Halovenus rubra]|uniref:Uncharacterized protein n=2 Tax=Halovenus rubra TaxID=869890 RepID=A0ACC7E173_9EURY|nr:hypothetical protein [Halovenus rubra]
MRPNRGISTVADVSLALVLVVAAVGVLAAFAGGNATKHNPQQTEYSVQTIAASTMNVSYTLLPAMDRHYETQSTINSTDDDAVERVAHEPVASLIADIAVANSSIGGQQLLKGVGDYERAVEEALQTRLVGSRFEMGVSAVWTPFGGAVMQGDALLGEQPPPGADVSTTTIAVPSGIPDARQAAIEAVTGPQAYDAVARAVANATISGYFPERETQLALERTGVDSQLTRYRYKRLATVSDGDPSVFAEHDWLNPSHADAGAANAYLSQRLTAIFKSQLQSLHGNRYENAMEAAKHVSTGTVTLTVNTWT